MVQNGFPDRRRLSSLAGFGVATESTDRWKLPIAMVSYKMPVSSSAADPEIRFVPL
jgi:hypothetical protein